MNYLKYKGFSASVEYSIEDKVLFGKIEYINDLVTFESVSAEDIEEEFHKAVDDYIEFCKSIGKEPEKSYNGSFNVRIAPELHRRAVVASRMNDESLNAYVERAISNQLNMTSVNLSLNVNVRQDVEIRKSLFKPIVYENLWEDKDYFVVPSRMTV